MNTIETLERLVGFRTVSRDSNLGLIEFARQSLSDAGAAVEVIRDRTGRKANLYATVGPRDRPGVVLSGHTDTVPVTGQSWSVPPFRLTESGGRLHGRGTADMKGFVASALVAAAAAARRRLSVPLHLALSHDEEIGCVGVRSLIDMLARAPFRPRMCIVGEPTSMAVATGHKGKTGIRATCVGREAHSAFAPRTVNAIHLATGLVGAVRDAQRRLARSGASDAGFDIPHTTLHVGRIRGGVALNIVPQRCVVDFEIRNLAGDDPGRILDGIARRAEGIAAAARRVAPEADIRLAVRNAYPGLETRRDSEVARLARALADPGTATKVPFGTEGGLFSLRLGVPTVVCGPGSMDQGHRPDEFVTEDQLARCDRMLAALVDRLASGI